MAQTILSGAEPFSLDGNAIGVLVSHGYTGSPQSMVDLARSLARDGGYTVRVPRLPGHGTTPQDMAGTGARDWVNGVQEALSELRERCRSVFVAGLSMGGTLALYLAGMYPDAVSGVMPINAPVSFPGPDLALLALAPEGPEFVPGIGSDICDPSATELAYSEVPVATIHQLYALVAVTADLLPRVSAPVLAFQSDQDHVVSPDNGPLILERVGSADKRLIKLARSYHVATLDFDKDLIAQECLGFIRERT